MPLCKVRSLSVFIIGIVFLAVSITNLSAREKLDYIFVLDTSYSMAGKGDKNIINSVKTSLNGYIDRIKDGDSLTFMTFADEVHIYPTVKIEDNNDRDIVKKYISVTQAKGAWTYTLEMINAVFNKATELQTQNKDNQVVIVIMTDALDDPPPSARKKKISVRDIAKAQKEPYVYWVGFADIKQNERVQKMAGHLAGVSSKTSVVTDKNPEKALAQVEGSVKERSDKNGDRTLATILLAIAGLILILLLFYLIRMLMLKILALRVKGYLDCRYIHSPYKDFTSYDLSKYNLKRITIGQGTEFNINVRDFAGKTPLVLEARHFDGNVHPIVNEEVSPPVEFLKGKKTSFLVDGDSFRAGDCQFIYRETV